MDTGSNVFGERLRFLRSITNCKTQKEFSEALQIPQPTLSAYESGKIRPTVDGLIKIADKFGVSLDWLCGRDIMFRIDSLGDVMSCFCELYETSEFSIKTKTQNNIDKVDGETADESKRDYVEIRVYNSSDSPLNMELCKIIEQAYILSNKLRKYELDQDSYEQVKANYIERKSGVPLTKIDHSKISEEERRNKMLEILKDEMEADAHTSKDLELVGNQMPKSRRESG